MKNDAESTNIVFHYGDFNVEASIKIHQSVFVDSSFDLGMIFIPPAPKFVDDTKQVLYQYNINQDSASQRIIDVMYELSRKQK